MTVRSPTVATSNAASVRDTLSLNVPKPSRYRLPVSREYLRELAARVRAVGIVDVARASGLHKNSIRRTITQEDGRNPTLETIAAIRMALAKLEKAGDPMPPPFVPVRGSAHYKAILAVDRSRRRKP